MHVGQEASLSGAVHPSHAATPDALLVTYDLPVLKPPTGAPKPLQTSNARVRLQIGIPAKLQYGLLKGRHGDRPTT